MNSELDYLLKYISNDCLYDILNNKGKYVIELVRDARVNVCHNTEYLIKYGVTNIDHVVYERLEELALPNNDFINNINDYERILSKDKIITMLENI